MQNVTGVVRRAALILTLAVCLVVIPGLTVAALHEAARLHFDRLSDVQGAAEDKRSFDAFKHAYASGVTTIALGDETAELLGHVVEFVEQDDCLEREHDLINNREGRKLALATPGKDASRWRERFAAALFAAGSDPETVFSIRRKKDPRVLAICGSG